MEFIYSKLFKLKNRGFTLIEIMIVISIMGILITAGGWSYISTIKKTRDSRRKSDLEQMRAALELYRSDEGKYPASLSGCGTGHSIASATNTYMQEIPCDPSGAGTAYCYHQISNFNYEVGADLEVNPLTSNCSTNCPGNDYCLKNP